MELIDKSSIISQFIVKNNPSEYKEFFQYNDLGIPLSFCHAYEICEPTSQGKEIIEETWINLCNILGVNPTLDYDSIDDMIGN